MKLSAMLAIAALSTTAGAVGAVFRNGSAAVQASDHDDGENEVKARNLNLTDLYVFREDWQTGVGGDADNLILIMNTNPRSVARQQYYFSDRALYEFHVSQVGTDPAVENDTPDEDVTLRFEFDPPDANDVQDFTLTVLADGLPIGSDTGNTTPLTFPATITTNSLSIAGQDIDVFAGLREDPFFFDVEQFFRVRAGLAGFGPAVTFRTPGVDFTDGYNVNTIVVRVPIALLAGASGADVFDVWETISIPAGVAVNQ